MIIKYRERHYTGKYTCIDYERTIKLYRTWIVGGLLYGYKNQFEVKAIPLDDILSIKE